MEILMKIINVYVDGSYWNKESHGGMYLVMDGVAYAAHLYTTDEELISMRNVSGEIIAAQYAIETLMNIANKYQDEDIKANLVYDYRGIEDWVSGVWKAKKKFTQEYASRVREIMRITKNLTINFVKVKGHSGVAGNEMADKIAAYDMEYVRDNNIKVIKI